MGRKAFFSGYKSFFNLGKTTFNVKIQLILNKTDFYNTALFFSNDVLAFLDLSYITVRSFKKDLNLHVYSYTIKDMNLFVEKKTNIGLFNLKDPLNLKIFVFCSDILSTGFLLQSFKINIT